MYQAILPIRGKILNVEKASIDKVLANAEIKTMINAFGCGFSEGYGNDFDISKLRYDKIIIMADADVDGAHISTLLLTLFYRFMPELIFEGHVYICHAALFYKAMPKSGKEEYLYDDRALEEYRKKHKGPFTAPEIQRSGRDGCPAALGDDTGSEDPDFKTGGDRRRPDGFQRDRDADGYRSTAERRTFIYENAREGRAGYLAGNGQLPLEMRKIHESE